MTARARGWRVVAALAAMVAPACARTETREPLQLRPLTKTELTPAEIKYGASPRREPRITYQRDVILVTGGAETIRWMGADGLTCTIDAHAPHADEIAVDKIAFVSAHCVGRVLAATREGDDLRLVLAPVELTDVFRDLHVTVNGPIDVEAALEYPAPQFTGTVYPLEGDGARFPDPPPPGQIELARAAAAAESRFYVRPAAWSPIQGPQGLPAAPGIPQRLDLSFHATEPLDKTFGPGIALAHDSNGLRLIAQFQVQMARPNVNCLISVTAGGIDHAHFILKNAAAIKVAFDAAANRDFSRNVSLFMPGLSLDIPVGVTGLSIAFRHGVWLDTNIAARTSLFSAGGVYRLDLNLGLRYAQRELRPVVPAGLTVEQDLFRNMSGVSVGATGLRLGHTLSVTAGIGALGFTAGPSVNLHTQFQIGRGPTITLVQCRDVAVAVGVDAGLGWSIPGPIADFANEFLRLIGVRPIANHGTLVKTGTVWPFNRRVQSAAPACRS